MDMTQFVIPKSDQLNADDLSTPRTIRITKVTGTGNADQPVSVHFDGDDGRPYKPCKSMRRVMIAGWGVDASQYVGRSMTLYRDPKVVFGGMEVGGIRISHMSNLDRPLALALTVTKAKRAPYKVAQMAVQEQPAAPDPSASAWDAGEVEKTQRFRIPLRSPNDGEIRYFADVPAWCMAFCELVNHCSPMDVWEANQETHVTLAKSVKDPTNQGNLKAAADYAFAASKDRGLVP